jgi:ABC-type lipoprotein export system ATPase subunit
MPQGEELIKTGALTDWTSTVLSSPQPTAHSPQPLLEARDLVRTYPDGEVQALRGVSLSIERGEWVAIMGPSGCGKSTLLHLLGGLDRPTSGEVYFEGTPLGALALDHYRARRLGFVFQSFHLLPTLSALENVQVPMFEGPWSRSERVARAEQLLTEVGLARRRDHLPNRLSVGERQRVAIARALANDPMLLLADEPTGNLDSQAQAEVLDLLGRLRRERKLTLVVVTHSAEVAAAADRALRLRDGRLVGAE